MALRTKLAADLGKKNIPKAMVQAVAPSQLTSLYWREEASNPPKTTVEIWMLANNSFIIVSGDFTKGEWGQGDVNLLGEPLQTIQQATQAAKESFTFGPIAEDEVAKEQVEPQPAQETEQPAQEAPTEENAKEEEKTASMNFRRLIKKN